MPAKNIIKNYDDVCIFHIYNRGVDRRLIFLSDDDFKKFERILEELSFKFKDYVDVLAYCLMPNHYHLLVFQKQKLGISKFVHSVMCRYGIYFNKKYGRSGRLCENVFKGSKIDSEFYLLVVLKYIHMNPKNNWIFYKYSSVVDYIAPKRDWINTRYILGYFNNLRNFMLFHFSNQK